MAIIPKSFMNSVVSIGKKVEDDIVWFGTGFFVWKKIHNDEGALFLITNKHVAQTTKSIIIRFREEKSENLKILEIPITTEDNEATYYFHPDADVDIAAIFIDGSFITKNKVDCYEIDIEQAAVSSDELQKADIREGAFIYMLGFPMGLVNEYSNTPICRLGCIARISESQIKETKSILIDVQNFPGNSGSPIMLRPEPVAIHGTKTLSKAVLIGIVHSYLPYKENLMNTQTKQIVEIRSENSGIALVHPVEFIKEIIEIAMSSLNFHEAEVAVQK